MNKGDNCCRSNEWPEWAIYTASLLSTLSFHKKYSSGKNGFDTLVHVRTVVQNFEVNFFMKSKNL